MIDLLQLRENFEKTRALLHKKEPAFLIDRLRDLDESVRLLQAQVEQARAEKNELAAQAKGGVTEEIRTRSQQVGARLKEHERGLEIAHNELNNLWLSCPNIPLDDVPVGGKEANIAIKEVGQKPIFSFTPQHHLDLVTRLGWVDFERAAAMSGAQFALYRGDGVKMLYALTQLMLKNNIKHGYEPIIPPYLVTERSLINSGNLPKFADDLYQIGADGLYVIPTAEVPLTNMYAGEIVAQESLPRRMTAWTSCFRREAGGYGAQERGLIRIHQFEKVELYSITTPEDSQAELERMVACGEELLAALGLHYRVSLLAGQDCSFSSAKTFDIEVWLPGQNRYYEVSSASNCTDFQARRAKIRYRAEGGKPQLAHTLNASALALPRLMVALIETYQQKDGSITLPLVLTEAMKQLW